MIKDIAFTVYAVTDIEKARAFYEGILGLIPGSEFDGSKNPSWIEYNVGSGVFAVGSSPDWKPSEDGAVIAFEVENFEEMVQKLKDANIPFKLEPQSFPTCHMTVVSDPDKNRVLIHKKKLV